MTREQVIDVLRRHGDELRSEFGVRSLSLFGSVVRGESGAGSDIDLLVEFAESVGFDEYMDLKFRLEDLLGCSVDLVMRSALRPFAIPTVDREAIRVA